MASPTSRLSYIDWMRGFICILMFQAHGYASWLSPELQTTRFYRFSQILGTVPAPAFLFLAGVSAAFVTEKMREKGIGRDEIAKRSIRRGAEIFALGLLFRAQEYALGYKWVPWTDLLRVDILNLIGLSLIFLGVFCWVTGGSVTTPEPAAAATISRSRSIVAALIIATIITMVTPLVWTTWRPKFLPWPLESYINGVHDLNEPQHWLFPIFPWSAFAFVGLAVGFFLFTNLTRRRESLFFAAVTAAGLLACALSVVFDAFPIHLYATYDYWHSSPQFFLLRCGVLLLLFAFAYAWCRWGFGQKGFSPAIQLGTTSLLVYWVHIEFVYGRLSIIPKHRASIPLATLGIIVIFVAMLGLSIARTRWKSSHKNLKGAPTPSERPLSIPNSA
jgi:uncharacterized membrane protein